MTIYYELEDRLYRAPQRDPALMDLRNPKTGQWERYRGDIAKVVLNAAILDKPPAKAAP